MADEAQALDDLKLLQNAGADHGCDAFNEVLIKHRDRLKRMVELRMNQRLQGRVDASDVIQDTFVEAARALESYLENPKISVFLWLRRLAGEKLIQAHRKHMGALKRSVQREQSIYGGAPAATSMALAVHLSGNFTSPSQAAVKQESKDQLTEALEQMDEVDREILTLRHFEQLSSKETAAVMEMNYEAVKKRYFRALDKLQKILSEASHG
jgi:RNA polymerase sigma-70 factor (ECF subfamily)